MKRNNLVLMLLLFGCLGVKLKAQTHSLKLSSQINITRYTIAHNFGVEIVHKKNNVGIYLGYNPKHLLRYELLSNHLKLSFSRELVRQEILCFSAGFDFFTFFRFYPQNRELKVASGFVGYSLQYGDHWQIFQSLQLGLSHFTTSNSKASTVQDFQIALGLKYRLK
jgi:hypothetical protein